MRDIAPLACEIQQFNLRGWRIVWPAAIVWPDGSGWKFSLLECKWVPNSTHAPTRYELQRASPGLQEDGEEDGEEEDDGEEEAGEEEEGGRRVKQEEED